MAMPRRVRATQLLARSRALKRRMAAKMRRMGVQSLPSARRLKKRSRPG
jgi:hypothetical protein